MQLYEQYRPTSYSDVIAQEKAVKKLEMLRKRGIAGRTYWLTGASGTGKTTIARLIAAEVADEWTITEIDASDCTPKRISDLEKSVRCRPIRPDSQNRYEFLTHETVCRNTYGDSGTRPLCQILDLGNERQQETTSRTPAFF